MNAETVDLGGRPLIIGGGIAGLMTALQLAPQPVVLLSKAPLGGQASSALAQGGLAASLGPHDDPALHLADTLAAGDGLCDAEVAALVAEAAPAAIESLMRFGVNFDREPDGTMLLGLEAAHSRHRIVHADGDGTGRQIMAALVARARHTPSITIIEHAEARRLIVEDGGIAGVLVAGVSGPTIMATPRVVIATGGIGGLFFETTNPLGCFGQGLALAARAGAELADLEFIQFHPTALDGPTHPMPLISEAVRGEGAALIDETGQRFLEPGAELAPRDILARAISRHLGEGHRVFLDARQQPGSAFSERFPAIHAICLAAGIDPARQPIPIRPAVHYHMGGIAVDASGRTSVPGLWACGEAASTGLHGANRLASNSLIEAAVFARLIAEDLAGVPAAPRRPPVAFSMPPQPDPGPIRQIMSRGLGILRSADELRDAASMLLPWAQGQTAAADPAAIGLMIAMAALWREESRGAHTRTDFPQQAAVVRRSRLRLEEAIVRARELEPPLPLARRA